MMRYIKTTFFAAAALLLTIAEAACGKATDTSSPVRKEEAALPKGVAKQEPKSQGALSDRVVVYYFHTTRRCATCLGIQKTIEQTLEDRFSEELAAGILAFEEINYEEPAGKPYVEKFQLSFGSMVVAQESKGKTVKWENADKVWDLSHDQPALSDYVEKSVRAFLGTLKGN